MIPKDKNIQGIMNIQIILLFSVDSMIIFKKVEVKIKVPMALDMKTIKRTFCRR